MRANGHVLRGRFRNGRHQPGRDTSVSDDDCCGRRQQPKHESGYQKVHGAWGVGRQVRKIPLIFLYFTATVIYIYFYFLLFAVYHLRPRWHSHPHPQRPPRRPSWRILHRRTGASTRTAAATCTRTRLSCGKCCPERSSLPITPTIQMKNPSSSSRLTSTNTTLACTVRRTKIAVLAGIPDLTTCATSCARPIPCWAVPEWRLSGKLTRYVVKISL